MKVKIKTNLTAGIVIAVFAVIMLLILPQQVREPMYDSGAPSPRIIPGICLVGMLICSAILIIQSLVFHKEHIYEFVWDKEKNELVLIALLIAFVAGTLTLGFVISGVVIFCLIEAFVGERKWYMFVYTIVAVFFVYFLFKNVFHIDLPNGVLAQFF